MLRTRPDETRRVYWMEYRRIGGNCVNDNTIPGTLVRFYDHEPISAPVTLSGKLSSVNEGSARKLRCHGANLR